MAGLQINENKCTDCRICQLVCSAIYTGYYRPKLARIRKVAGIFPDTTDTYVCWQCSDAQCVAVCPTEALKQKDGEGTVILEQDLCTGCGICVDECAYEAIWFNAETDIVYKCELCGGDPECLKRCPTKAISLDGKGI